MQEHFRRRRLPHWDKPGAIYFVTSCLEGSIPAQGLKDIATYRSRLKQPLQLTELSEKQWATRSWKLTFARAEEWLDLTPAARHLQNACLAEEVEKALLHFAGQRYAI